MTDEQPNQDKHEQTHRGGDVEVSFHDTVGALFMGIIALILLVVFLRERTRSRELHEQLMRRQR